MKKLFLFVSIFIFIPFFSRAQQNCPNCFTDQGSCVNGTCQPRRCGDGVCNDCSYAFSPCIAQETSSSCPQDCKSTTPTPTPQFKETDSGKDYYLKGITTGYEAFSEKIPPNILNKEDHCSATCFGNAEQNKTAQGPCLIEYFLDPNQYANYETVACENGCAEGVCVKSISCPIGSSVDNAKTTDAEDGYQSLKSGDILYFTLGAKGSANSTRIYKYISPRDTYLQIGLADMTQSTGFGDSDLIIKYSGSNCEAGAPTPEDHLLARNYWQKNGNSVWNPPYNFKQKGVKEWAPKLAKENLFYRMSEDNFEFIEIPEARAGCYYIMVTNTLDSSDDYLRLTMADLNDPR